MKSEPVTERKAPGLAGDCLGEEVLPVPGGPTSSTPLGTRAPISGEAFGVLQEVDDLVISCLTPS